MSIGRESEPDMTREIIIFSFTKNGTDLNRRICQMFQDDSGADDVQKYTVRGYAVKKYAQKYEGKGIRPLPDPVKPFIADNWGRAAFVFVGAAGIAVRYIAPFVKDKFTDSPVLVIDEKGQYVIPVLSGHVGGAAFLADEIAAGIGAAAVHTTATDVQGKFAVDVFAKRNDLYISDREAAKRISAAVLEGERPGFFIACEDVEIRGNVPEELLLCKSPAEAEQQRYRIVVASFCGDAADVRAAENMTETENTLVLCPRRVTAGIGCRRGISLELLEKGFLEVLKKNRVRPEEVEALASIDLKKNEPALRALSEKYRIPFFTYPAEQLKRTGSVSSGSAFVEQVTGVDNVCERAALLHSREGRLIQEKWKGEQMTAALAIRPVQLYFL